MSGNYFSNKNGFYGRFGGTYVPEILHKCVSELQEAYLRIMESDEFKRNIMNCCVTMWAVRRLFIMQSE